MTEAPDLRAWIGRSQTIADTVTATPYAALSATLDWPIDWPGGRPPAGTPLPALWHWLYFLPLYRQSDAGADGHAQRGGFLPPVPLPRRMWAGSQIDLAAPALAIGDAIERTSTIADVSEKSGRTGRLVFVRVHHQVRRAGAAAVAISEFHDIVYREAARPEDVPPPPKAAPAEAPWSRRIVPDDLLLFRYSALTFNGHRIHYDRRYVTGVEGYPGLIVHGPLLATLMCDLVRRQWPDRRVSHFEFRAMRPVFDLHPFEVCGRPEGDTVHVWVRDHEGWLAMDGKVAVAA